jgi:hypothetical protein
MHHYVTAILRPGYYNVGTPLASKTLELYERFDLASCDFFDIDFGQYQLESDQNPTPAFRGHPQAETIQISCPIAFVRLKPCSFS